MPTSELFDFMYDVSGTLGSTPTVGFTRVASTDGIELQDSADSLSDGMTSSGNDVLVISSLIYGPGGDRGNMEFVGFTSNGDVILQGSISGGPIQLYVFSDTNYPDGGATTFGSTAGGTYLYCFAAGTMIATPAGREAVETLSIGTRY